MVFSVPLNTVIAGLLKKMQEKQMKNRDQRTKMMSELLNNIKRYVVTICFRDSKHNSMSV